MAIKPKVIAGIKRIQGERLKCEERSERTSPVSTIEAGSVVMPAIINTTKAVAIAGIDVSIR